MGNRIGAVYVPWPTPGLAYGLLGQESAQGVAAQGHNYLWGDHLQLAVKVLATGGHLPRQGIAVVEGAALHRIGDVYVLAAQAGQGQELLKEVTGSPDKGAALLVLVETRSLSDEHYLRVLRSLSGHRIGPVAGEGAIGADRDFTAYLI